MKSSLTKEAKVDLVAISTYTLAYWNEKQLDKYMAIIERGVALIEAKPEIGKKRVGISDDVRTFSAGEHYILYRIHGNIIRIIRILHQSMDLTLHL